MIDTATNTVTATITSVGDQPEQGGGQPRWHYRLRRQHRGRTVSVIDTATNTVTTTVPVGGGPVGLAISPDGATVYVTSGPTDTVSVIDTATNTVATTVGVGDAPAFVAINPDGATAYVTNHDDGTVSVIDTATNTVVATITGVGVGALGVAFSPDGSHRLCRQLRQRHGVGDRYRHQHRDRHGHCPRQQPGRCSG